MLDLRYRAHASLVVACGLSSGPTACGILVSHLGIEAMSPALASRYLTTGPSEKPLYLLNYTFIFNFGTFAGNMNA